MQGLLTNAGNANTRVDMTAKKISFVLSGERYFGYIVYKRKITIVGSAIDHFYACIRIPVTVKDIMIAHYQLNIELFKIPAPFYKKGMLFIVAAVKHVADHEHVFGFKGLEQRNKPLYIFFKNILWYGNAAFPEMPAFAQVKIAQQECFLILPENAFVC